ncbi:MAG TPA: type II secretion system F family protein [Actinomycetes bacterium]|nr:type II secretion system F family protein [Actinomycetes bacterium]
MTLAYFAAWLLAAAGIWLVVNRVPLPAGPAFRDRVLPYLGQAGWRVQPAVEPASITLWFPRSMRRGARTAAGRLAWISGSDGSARRRLDVLGDGTTIDDFRLEQLLWGLGGGAASLGLVLLRGLSSSRLIPSLIIVALGVVAGVLARDRLLTVQVQRRAERLRSELPTIVEMLAMAVGAGSGLVGALERVSRLGAGVVAAELGRALADVRVGLPLLPALQQMADRNDSAELRRFVDAVVVSVERGTPLADVLVAQAGDAREAARRALIESGGRKEIGMMVPVVFLVLPLSVVFVLFPGFYGLRLGA